MKASRARPFLAAASFILVAACGGSAGGPAADGTQDFIKAADALLAKVGKPGEKSQMPAADDPAVKAFDAQAEKGMTALGTDAMPVTGFDSFDTFCGKTTNIVGAYVSAGGSGGASDPQQMARNVEHYLRQMFTPLLFSAHCIASHAPFLEKTLTEQNLRTKPEAFQKVRGGVYAQVAGLLQMAAADDAKPDERKRILDLLSSDASKFAIVLSPEQRRQVAAMAQEAEAKLPADRRGQLGSFRTVVTGAPCGKLCSAA
jgi:hypothetical protein